jgi:hypothetical protein
LSYTTIRAALCGKRSSFEAPRRLAILPVKLEKTRLFCKFLAARRPTSKKI